MITLLTVVPTFVRPMGDTSLWFSFGYLRATNAVTAVNKIEQMGALKDVSDVSRMYIHLSLKTFTMIACLVGTTFVLEILGDPGALQDQFIETDMGGLSVIQLMYWIFTTISTVGYGDFAPKTVLSRLFIIVAIVVGVIFFSEMGNEVVNVFAMESSGRGQYGKRRGTEHVVLIGGGVRQFSSVVRSLMNELYSDTGETWPDLIIMASTEQPELLGQAIKAMPKQIRTHIKYYMGDPTEPADMARVRMKDATLVIIIPSLLAPDMDAEDEANILRGLAVKHVYPKTSMRLMLLRSNNKKLAVQVGFSPARCFSINEQKSGLFALACCCPGFSTIITQFIMDHRGGPEDGPSEKKGSASDDWVVQYREGRKFHMCGFMVNSNYAGISFGQFAILCSKRSITPIAVQIDGKLFLAPDHTLDAGDVVFALVRNSSSEAIEEFRQHNNTTTWREAFKERQTCALAQAKMSASETHSPNLPWAQSTQPLGNSSGNLLALPPVPPPGAQVSEVKEGVAKEKVSEEDVDKALRLRLQRLEAKGRRIAETGGHHILVLLSGAPWQQVQVFLNTSRAKHMPFHIPILVLIPPPFPQAEQLLSIFKELPRTAFMRSLATPNTNDLRNCGMARARCIALLAGNAGQANSSDRRMVDGAGVTLLACIEGELMATNSPNVPVFLELHQQESVRFLSRFFPRDDDGQGDAYDPSESFTFHPRFANGNIFTASCFGATVARSFNMPGIVELMEAITLGFGNEQSAFPWQVTCPHGFEGKMYGDLVAAFLESHNAVCLGVFRLCFPGGFADGPRFVVTNPDQSMELRDNDFFFVLGSSSFGQYCFDQNLLASAQGAPSATEPEEPLPSSGNEEEKELDTSATWAPDLWNTETGAVKESVLPGTHVSHSSHVHDDRHGMGTRMPEPCKIEKTGWMQDP